MRKLRNATMGILSAAILTAATMVPLKGKSPMPEGIHKAAASCRMVKDKAVLERDKKKIPTLDDKSPKDKERI